MNTLEKIIEIISEKTDINPELLDEDTQIEEIGADSIDIVEMLMTFEDEFDIDIPDEKIKKIKNLGELERYIEENRL